MSQICIHGNDHCERIHEGDTVRVVHNPAQLGFGQLGTVVKHGVASLLVHFPDGVAELDLDGKVLDMIEEDLFYTEAELEKVSF